MGRIKKDSRKTMSTAPSRRLPLDADDSHIVSCRVSRAPKNHESDEKADMVCSDISAKIMREAIKQKKEIEEEDCDANAFSDLTLSAGIALEDVEEDIDGFDGFSDTHSQSNGDLLEVDEEAERMLAAFLVKDACPVPTLADIVFQNITKKETEAKAEVRKVLQLDSKVIDLYEGVGKLLSRYTAGRIPKAFKRIPSLELWQDVLHLTNPPNWSPNAVYQATRIFCSNVNTKKAQRFCSLVLLPRLRSDIREHKRLHFALYQSLKKTLYKPAAFFMGILLPLCKSGDCILREAVIIGSIIQKVSIPVAHSSAALVLLTGLDYYGTTSYFIKLLLDKKYALPYSVLDAVHAHFMRFIDDERNMPVIWHQSLLTFVQRYKNELTKDDKDNLEKLMQRQKHYKLTPEIQQELGYGRNRGEKDIMPISAFSHLNKPVEEDRLDIPDVPMDED